MSIRRRIFLGIIVLFSVGFYLLIDLIADDIQLRYRESTEEPLVDSARVLAALASASTTNGKIDIALFRVSFEQVQRQTFTAQIFALIKENVDLHVYITDEKGIVLFDSYNGKDEGLDYSNWRDVHRTLRGDYGARTSDIEGQETVTLLQKDEEKKMIYVASPILRNNDLIGVLSVGKPTHSSNQFAKAAKNKLIIGGTIICLLLIVIGLLLGLWVTRPINILTQYVMALADGKRIKKPKLSSGEMQQLGIAFEQMRDALDGKNYVENYVQNLTHEIKSPISAIRGAVELLEEYLPFKQKQTLLQNIHLESDRISQIVDNLLLLSSLESRKYINFKDPIEVHEMIDGIKTTLTPLLLVKQMTLSIQGNSLFQMQGEVNLIHQALMNIVQNAIDFSSFGANIILTISSNELGVEFQVRDFGSGIPDYAGERIFERFYSLKRPESGRKSSGLGLSLVSEIMSLHQGTISVVNHPDGGSIAKLYFPFHTNNE